jgi:hypothetical protein
LAGVSVAFLSLHLLADALGIWSALAIALYVSILWNLGLDLLHRHSALASRGEILMLHPSTPQLDRSLS